MSSFRFRSALAFIVAGLVGVGMSPALDAQDDHDHDAAPHEEPNQEEDVFLFEDAPPQHLLRQAFGGPRARLGVSIEPTDDGLIVREVESDSLAAAAGVAEGDLLLRVGKTRIQTSADVAAALAGKQAGDEVTVAVVREGAGLVELTGSLPAVAAPAAEAGSGLLGVNLDEQDGRVLVAGVVDQSGAWFAGLAQGDLLLDLDGQAVATPEDVVGLVGERAAGDFVALGVERDGARLDLRARLGARNTGERLLRFVNPGGTGMLLPGGGAVHRIPGNRTFGLQGQGGQGGKLFRFQGDGIGDLHTWFEQLHEDGVLPDGQGHQTRVEIRDGVMTIERDGKLETYKLEGQGDTPFPRMRKAAPADDHAPQDVGWVTDPQDV